MQIAFSILISLELEIILKIAGELLNKSNSFVTSKLPSPNPTTTKVSIAVVFL
ncbi:hypothetical protein K4H48_09475 [Clostridium chauvoei]|uniref:hypothetical protein n=1 Tax=Clostridium chauvoei TaxID=46867 RepID=UPI001C858DF4|nr:hypothetical protein [Clostridium chauvoei]MBX7293764.1 hypothetical protein [Clostridium chauvoei]